MRSPRISRPSLRTIGKWLLAVLAGVAGMFLVFLFTSDDPLSAVQGLLFGGFSSPGRMSQWILYSSFLMLTGASVCLVFRVGMFSLGAEGQVFIGALAGGFVVLSLGSSPATLLLGILASIAGGFLWGVLPGLMKAYLAVDEIVSTLMMNYIATFGFAFIIKQFLQPPNAGYPVSEFFLPDAWLPAIGTSPAISLALPLGILVCIGASLLLSRTRFGYQLRMVGDSPKFAHANGMPVARLVWLSIALSGAVAGLAGAAIAFGSTHRLILGMATGIGFDGILVALLALNRPALVPLTALIYGYIRTGGDVIQITSNVPRDVVVVLQGVVILVLAALLRRRAAAKRSIAADVALESVAIQIPEPATAGGPAPRKGDS
jgi:simple sugar transport system permease protein